MCGIFGILSNKDDIKLNALKKRVIKTKNKLKHRGPDDHGINSYKIIKDHKNFLNLFFGHTRLSIIELSSQSHSNLFISHISGSKLESS